jgi:hypothetical protein
MKTNLGRGKKSPPDRGRYTVFLFLEQRPTARDPSTQIHFINNLSIKFDVRFGKSDPGNQESRAAATTWEARFWDVKDLGLTLSGALLMAAIIVKL